MDIQTTLRQYYDTYNSEDPEALAAFYHPDVVLTSAQGVLEGVEAILDTYRSIIAVFQDRMEPLSIAVDGDIAEVVINDTFTARQDVDDFMGVPVAKGDTLELRLLGKYHVEGGRFRAITITMHGG